jgi:predicted RND superfamily exporter protein
MGLVAIAFLASLTVYTRHLNNSDNSLPVWLHHADPDYVNYQNYLKTFSNDRFLVVAFEVPNAFGRSELAFVSHLSTELLKLSQVEKVDSLTTVQNIESRGEDLVTGGLFEVIPTDEAQLKHKKSIALNDDNIRNVLVSADGHVTAIYLRLNVEAGVQAANQLLLDVERVVTTINKRDYVMHVGGPPATDSAFERLSRKDQQTFLPVIHLVIFGIVLLFFRNFFIALIPILIQILIVIFTMAVYFLMGNTLNVVTAVMGPVLVAVCVADCVHFMLAYYEGLDKGLLKLAACVDAAVHSYVPCFFTALTTFAGFIAFNASPIVPNKVLGQYTAFGVMLAYVFTILFIPVVLSFLPDKHRKVALIVDDNIVQRFLAWAFRQVDKRAWLVALFFIVATVLSVIGVSRVGVETNTIDYFPKGEKVRTDVAFFEEHLSGGGSFELVLDGRDPKFEIAKDPRLLKMIELFRIELLQDPLTRKVIAYTDMLKKLNRAFHENDQQFFRVPDTKDEIAQLLFLAESAGDRDLVEFKSIDNSQIHIAIRSNWKSSELMNAYLKKTKRLADAYFAPMGVDVIMTGVGALWIKVDDNILTSEYYGFLSALVMVIIMMVAVLRSVKAGIVSMVPNVAPILFATGLMGFLGFNLNVSTVMTAGIAMGITVDDSIHYLVRFKAVLRRVGDYRLAIAETNKSIGTAVVFTTFVLMAGFGVLTLSQFSPSVDFGAMTVLTLFLSIFCEIFLMPLMLLWLKPFPILVHSLVEDNAAKFALGK